jgi:multidrug efflux system membrane fusion protein
MTPEPAASPPAPRQPKQGRWRNIFLAIGAIIAVIVLVRLFGVHGKRKVVAHAAIPVTLARAGTEDVPVYLDALGTVVAYRTVTVQPMITGPLDKVLFHEGQSVKKGEEIAEIDPAPYEAALAQAQAKLAQDQATLANAELQNRQYQALVKNHYTSTQQAAAAQAAVLEGRALVKQDQATIKTDQINLGYTKILASISGMTGILQVNAGNIVNPNLSGGIVVINTLQPISVQFSLPQQDLPQVQRALQAGSVPAIATAEGDPQTAKILDRGVVSVLDNTVNASTGTLTLKARFPNPKLELWPGAYVNVRVLAQTLSHVVTVPPVAVQQGPAGSFVYLLKPASGHGADKVAVQPVTIQYENQKVAVISKGLAAGDQVVTEGNSLLKDGAAVRPVPAPPVVAASNGA